MASKRSKPSRRPTSRKRHRSPSRWWTDFKRTDRYRLTVWIAKNTYKLVVFVGDQPSANAAIRTGATKVGGAAKRGASNRGTRLGNLVHGVLDNRDLNHGVLSDHELNLHGIYVRDRPKGMSVEEALKNWREAVLENRRGNRGKPISTNGAQGAAAPIPIGWQPPRPAPSRPPGGPPIPARRPGPRKVNRADQLRNAWASEYDKLKAEAMANGELKGALATLRAFVEEPVQNRYQLHAHLAEMAAFAEALGDVFEEFQATLQAARRDGSPGVPPVVTRHLAPVGALGEQIGQCCADTSHAFEDEFAEAIVAANAANASTRPSDDFLTG